MSARRLSVRRRSPLSAQGPDRGPEACGKYGFTQGEFRQRADEYHCAGVDALKVNLKGLEAETALRSSVCRPKSANSLWRTRFAKRPCGLSLQSSRCHTALCSTWMAQSRDLPNARRRAEHRLLPRAGARPHRRRGARAAHQAFHRRRTVSWLPDGVGSVAGERRSGQSQTVRSVTQLERSQWHRRLHKSCYPRVQASSSIAARLDRSLQRTPSLTSLGYLTPAGLAGARRGANNSTPCLEMAGSLQPCAISRPRNMTAQYSAADQTLMQ